MGKIITEGLPIDMGLGKITSLGAPVAPDDAARLQDVQVGPISSVVTIAALTGTSVTSLGDGTLRFVDTVKDYFRLEKTSAMTADGITILTALGGTGRWIRLNIPHPFWALQTDWYIDPAQTNAQPGNDENTGLLTTAPLKSIAEWRRRISGVQFDQPIKIHPLSSSTVIDDGNLTGFTTVGLTGQVFIIGTSTVLFTGSITSYQAYSGNTRGSVTDTAIPVSWTASNGISDAATGSRWIRKTGTDKRAHLVKDMGSKTVMIGIPATVSETATTFPSQAITDFQVGDSYEVISLLKWPELRPGADTRIRYQCIDVSGPSNTAGAHALANEFVLCGILTSQLIGKGITTASGCIFLGPASSAHHFAARFCTFKDADFQLSSPTNWNTTTNVFINSSLLCWHGGNLDSSGTLWFFDTTAACLSVIHGSRAGIFSFVGDGNTSSLIQVGNGQSGTGQGNQVYGASHVTAITSDPLPFKVNGVAYSTPVVSAASGDGIYN